MIPRIGHQQIAIHVHAHAVRLVELRLRAAGGVRVARHPLGAGEQRARAVLGRQAVDGVRGRVRHNQAVELIEADAGRAVLRARRGRWPLVESAHHAWRKNQDPRE